MKLYINLLIIGLILFSTNCTNSTDFDRDNKNDPHSKNFIPKINSFEASLNSDKTVSLSWKDHSNFEDGFIIGKSFGANSDILILDTLPPNSTFYLDNSGSLALQTWYHLAAYKNQTTATDTLLFRHTEVQFGEIINIDHQVTNGNEIGISWSSSIAYADQFVIKKSNSLQSDITIDSVSGNQFNYTYFESDELYSMQLSATALLLDNEGNHQNIHTKSTDTIYINQPTDFKKTVTDEETIRINWNDNSAFDDQLIIYQRPAKNRSTPGNGAYYALDTLSNPDDITLKYQEGHYYEFKVTPVYESHRGRSIGPMFSIIRTQAPSFTAFQSTTEKAAELYWRDNNTDRKNLNQFPTKRFILERSINNGDYKFYKEFEPSKTSTLLENLNQSDLYKYRIRSLSSGYSHATIAYRNILLEVYNKDINYWEKHHNYKMTPLNTFLAIAGKFTNGTYGIKLIDPINASLAKNIEFKFGFRDFKFSEQETYVALFGSEVAGVFNLADSTDVPLYNFKDLNPYSLQRLEGVFITDHEMILSDYDKLIKLNIQDHSVSLIKDFTKQFSTDFRIYQVNRKGTSLLLKTTRGDMIYYLETNSYQFTHGQEVATPINENEKGEVLYLKSDSIELHNKEGKLLQSFNKPEIYPYRSYKLTTANFISDDVIIVGTDYGIVFLFEKNSGDYISFFHLKKDGEKIYNRIKVITVNKTDSSILIYTTGFVNRLKLSQDWTLISYED